LTEWLHKSKRPIDIDTGTLLFVWILQESCSDDE
jgi:hypothetical protein